MDAASFLCSIVVFAGQHPLPGAPGPDVRERAAGRPL